MKIKGTTTIFANLQKRFSDEDHKIEILNFSTLRILDRIFKFLIRNLDILGCSNLKFHRCDCSHVHDLGKHKIFTMEKTKFQSERISLISPSVLSRHILGSTCFRIKDNKHYAMRESQRNSLKSNLDLDSSNVRSLGMMTEMSLGFQIRGCQQ